ncbi:A disintegrin and metalloproteinase with thrombospondin motifs 2-like [Bacillus rossius redtenbacheri]|uniref:A disintegrin and metalloproteinase with thrombospondin motifs 2-like n=1 Tax=Bacillus rossius redtenbacheri TaxID=93214 RepID=UPI002FDDB54A
MLVLARLVLAGLVLRAAPAPRVLDGADYELVFPRVVGRRQTGGGRWKRDEPAGDDVSLVSLKDWLLELRPNAAIEVAPTLEWHSPDGWSSTEVVRPCSLQVGRVRGVGDSLVALAVDGDGMTGLVRASGEAFFLSPLPGSSGGHALYRAGEPRDLSRDQQPRARRQSYWSSNVSEERRPPHSLDDVGYFLDAVWERDNTPQRHAVSAQSAPPRWLELALAVDHSVISFHGADRAQHYVIALMNIVSAIYKDSSLSSNLKLVIVRMIFYQDESLSEVQEGNSKRSLERVNAWNQRLLSGLAPDERHDVAVWLTRLNLGGPSGYAPVSGACDPARSCALNRDEGLTSAFIIAHEVAHLLGLSHDGDPAAGNDCGEEAMTGSVMAPMVAATFHRFSWSRCSYTEFHDKAANWKCLLNTPRSVNATHLNSTLQATYSMDEQCRLEFGDGYSLCRVFELPEPCSHLWCGRAGSDVCKTKKGPPLEGTQCGAGRWCVGGYCEQVDPGVVPGRDPVLLNPRHGGWGAWGPWGPCSRSCGPAVRFRSRRCDNPRPEHGGEDCRGRGEEMQLCAHRECPEPRRDFRAEQCRRLPALVPHAFSRWLAHTWLPHEPPAASKKCQLICVSKETKKVFATGENVVDGTRCSYDGGTNICIQGECQRMGCDGVLDSPAQEDWCGLCGGNGTGCVNVTTTFHRKLRRQVTRVAVLPRLARNVRLEVDGEVGLLLRDRRRGKQYSLDGEASLVVEGARFHHLPGAGRHALWAAGPLLQELVLSVVVAAGDPADAEVRCTGSYTVRRQQEAAARRYVWAEGGWGPCSRSCGGGRRQRTAACRDTHTGRLAPRGRCSLLTKPAPAAARCNTFSCEFHWRPGPWEHCSATCGSRGSQSREVFCVHGPASTSPGENPEPWRGAADPRLCAAAPRPPAERPCNREPCPVRWLPGEWSQCSASCGVGVEMREFRCPAPRGEPLFDCGASPPDQQRACRGRRRTDPLCQPAGGACPRDASRYCRLTSLLGRYCAVPGYRRLCCRTCRRLME